MQNKVLVVGPGRKSRGGITSVINAYEKTFIWNKWKCFWIESHIDKPSLFKIFYFLRGLIVFALKVGNAEIIHIHLSESTSAIRKSVFFYIAYFNRKKIILHFHAFSPDTTINGKYKSMYRDMFIKSDLVLVLSPYWQKEIMTTFGENIVNIKVLYNPCINTGENEYSISKRKHYILYAGTLNKRKGYADLLNAFKSVATEYSDWNLVLAGNGEIENGIDLAKNLEISNQVIFTGWISGKEKEKLFQEASIFCLPSYNEGFPMAVLDAISFGLPIITTPVGGILDIFSDGLDAIIFNPGDIDELSNKIKLLIKNHQLRNQLSQASIRLSKTTFCLDTIVKKLDYIYSNL